MIQAIPGQPVRLTLSRHAHLPEEQRPWFEFKALMRRETKLLAPAMKSLNSARLNPNDPNALELAYQALDDIERALCSALTGWGNQTDADGNAVAFDRANFDMLVNESDMGELMRLLQQGGVTETDAKKSDSLSPAVSEPVVNMDAA